MKYNPKIISVGLLNVAIDVYVLMAAAWIGEARQTYHGVGAKLHIMEKFGLITSLYLPCLLLLFVQLKCDGCRNVYIFGV
jgi:hypothetical protein